MARGCWDGSTASVGWRLKDGGQRCAFFLDGEKEFRECGEDWLRGEPGVKRDVATGRAHGGGGREPGRTPTLKYNTDCFTAMIQSLTCWYVTINDACGPGSRNQEAAAEAKRGMARAQ